MPRAPADIQIRLKRRGGPTCRIELIRIPFTRRFRIRRDGTRSRKLPEATATEIADVYPDQCVSGCNVWYDRVT